MVHPLTITEMYIDPLKQGQGHEDALYPNGAHLTDLREIRDLVYKMQRPGIVPDVRPNFIHWHPSTELVSTERNIYYSWFILTNGESFFL